MAERLTVTSAVENVSMPVEQTLPVSLDRLSLPRVKAPKSTVRKSIQIPLTESSLEEDLESVQTPLPSLMSSGLCHVSAMPSQMGGHGCESEKMKCATPESHFKVPERQMDKSDGLGRGLSSADGGCEDEPGGVLTALGGGGSVDSSTIVIGEGMTGCVVVDLQGNMVVQEHSADQTSAGPYLVEEQLLVQVTQEAQHQQAELANNTRVYAGGPQYIRGNAVDPIFSDLQRKGVNKKQVMDKKEEIAAKTNCKALQSQPNFESRWNFREVLVKPECPLISLGEIPEEEFLGEEDSENEEQGRPRRKSAKKARLRWKNIHEVDDIGKLKTKKPKRLQMQPREKGNCMLEKVMPSMPKEQAPSTLPLWAQRLTSVRLVDDMWVVGVASSSSVLHQTLEGHSRSVLCDYIKSHPSSLEQRHRTRAQVSRIMWHHQRIMFDGVPFTIVSSDDLKCAFGMNYKIKRKGTDASAEGKLATNKVEEEFVEEEAIGGCTELKEAGGEGHPGKEQVTKIADTNNQPKKRYKDVTYTSCTARITVKVIVKYPGYAVSPNATAKERKVMLKALRRDIEQGLALEKEELYHVTMPLSSVHNHPLQGKSRGVHPSITNKIKELVSKGITAPKVIKGLLDDHVKKQHFEDMVVPHDDDRAYYPRLKDIANLVYTQCKKMGISAKRKVVQEQPALDTTQKKRKKHKKARIEDETEAEGSDNVIGDSMPLQASTLQEAVQTFCTDDPDRGSSMGGVSERECLPPENLTRDNSGEVASLAEVVRGQLDTLRSLTYSITEAGPLHEICQSLQMVLNQYMGNSHHSLPLPEGMSEASGTATAFIIQEPMVGQLSSSASPAQTVPETTADPLDMPDRDAGGSGITVKARSAHSIGSQQVRQLRPPVALQCLTTSMVPTLAVSQLPRVSTQTPHQTHTHTHIMTSLPTHNAPAPATPLHPPTYQTLGPAASQEGSPAQVHVSLPPYFYYVQEVTVPETSQSWTYTSSS